MKLIEIHRNISTKLVKKFEQKKAGVFEKPNFKYFPKNRSHFINFEPV